MTRIWMVKRIGLWSAVRTGFVVSAALGLITGLFWGMAFAFFASLFATAASVRDPGAGPAAVIILPIFGALFCGALGAILSLLSALAYNLTAGALGGLDLEIEDGAEPAPAENAGNVSAQGVVYKGSRRIWRRPTYGLAAHRKKAGKIPKSRS